MLQIQQIFLISGYITWQKFKHPYKIQAATKTCEPKTGVTLASQAGAPGIIVDPGGPYLPVSLKDCGGLPLAFISYSFMSIILFADHRV